MKAKRFLSVLMAVMLIVSCFAISASAATKPTTATLNIHLYESKEGQTTADATGEELDPAPDNKAIANVKFNVYAVDADETSKEVPENVTPVEMITDPNGLATQEFAAGRYLVVMDNTTKPTYVSGTVANFLVDLPLTNTTGDGYIQDVHVYPKLITTGAIEITKTFNGAAPTGTESATFTLTKSGSSTGTDYTANADNGGVIRISGLDFATYTLVEKEVTSPYVKLTETWTITVSEGGAFGDNNADVGTVVRVDDNNKSLTIKNKSSTTPEVSKSVSSDGTSFGNSASINAVDANAVATWKITASLPNDINSYKSYVITDAVDSRLIPDTESVVVKDDNTTLTEGFTASWNGNTLTVTLTDLSKFTGGHALDITFTTKIDLTQDDTVATAIPNDVEVTYKNANDQTGTVDNHNNPDDPDDPTDPDNPNKDPNDDPTPSHDPYIYTGQLNGVKVDVDEVTITNDVAKFVLYKEDKTTKVADITTVDGKFTVTGLADGTYYLQETEAPDGYELNSEFIAVTIGVGTLNTDGLTVDNVVVNKNITNIPSTDLPLTGGVGTTMFAIIGIAFVAVGGTFLFKSKKAKNVA